MLDRNGESHSVLVEAASLFDAAHKGQRKMILLWYYSRDARLKVRMGEREWLVSQERVKEWAGVGGKRE